MSFSQWVSKSHYSQKPFLGFVGQFLSLFYALGLRLNQVRQVSRLNQQRAWPCPVVSVGNLTTGGTGKTPVTLAIARVFEDRGLLPVILSRGYRAKNKSQSVIPTSSDDGDEAFLMQQQLTKGKVVVGSNRVASAEYALRRFKPDVLILDDGFQAIACHRTLNIVLVDGEHGFGNGYLLPAGPLREPTSHLARADVILLTKSESFRPQIEAVVLKTGCSVPIEACPFAVTGFSDPISGEAHSVDSMAGRPVVLLSGIAQPTSFEAQVQSILGVPIQQHCQKHWMFSDHHEYSLEDIQPVLAYLEANPEMVLVTTRKDWVKLAAFKNWPLGQVRVMDIEPQCDWDKILSPVLDELLSAQALKAGFVS